MSEQGNIAAMREALVLSRERIVETKGYYDADADKEDYETLLAAIDAVLAAPDRNCDRFGDYHDAVDAWHKEELCCGRRRDGGTCEKDPLAPTLAPVCFAHWLYAPAEGGDHA